MSNTKKSAIAHLAEQERLLRMEYEHEKAEFERQTQLQGLERLVKRGMCWMPVAVGRSYYNSLNQLVVEIQRRSDDDIEHNFEYGRAIRFFRIAGNGSIEYFHFNSTVSYADDSTLVAVMPSHAAIVEVSAAERAGVQIYFDATTYRAMFDALSAATQAKGNRLAELREVILGDAAPQFRPLRPMAFPWLNKAQEAAVNQVLCARDVAIVHGPPGTGKTTTLVEAIYETLHREPQVLVCAQSNTAVDWISEKLVDRGINVLRIGNPTRVNDKMLSFTYERRFEAHPSYTELWAIRKELRALHSRMRGKSHAERESTRARIAKLRDRAQELEVLIDADLFNSANVVASTLTGTANRLMYGHRFGTLFIDEAAQALEAACWIAMPKADRVVLAGDHKQLPPTIKCIEAARAGLDTTMLELIAIRHPQAVTLLQMQYRMHRLIMQFSSDNFYGGNLLAAPEVECRGILDFDNPISWIDTADMDFKEEFVGQSFGRINKAEAELLIERLQEYISRIGLHRVIDERIDFGIISPYRAQVQYLRHRIKSLPDYKRLKSLISINTVDGFQGQERDVIFISLVRANDDGQIGFLHDLRRMNVAMTRARMKLVICGDSATLCRHPFYRRLMAWILENS